MTLERRRCVRLALFLWVVPFVLASGPGASPARADGDRILAVTKNAIYGGATGLLLGGVLTLVVPSENRDDVVRWGVVVGTFAGFGYGLYEVAGPKDEFTERVRTRADARLQARTTTGSEAAIGSARAATTPGGPISWRGAAAFRPRESSRCRKFEERPEPATGGATGRTSW